MNSIADLQEWRGLAGLMQAATFLGNEEFYLALIPLLYLCVSREAGLRLGLLVLLGDSLNNLVKVAFGLPRPYWIHPRLQMARDTSYGFPSSHAQNAVSVWFFFATLPRRPRTIFIAILVALVLVLLISISRVYLGVHFWTDIFGGWLIGGVFLLAFLRIEPRAREKFEAMSLLAQIVTATALAIGIFLLGRAVYALPPLMDDAAWARLAQDARNLEALTSRTGSLWGLGIGWAMALRWAPFDAAGPLWQRVLRFVIGFTGVLLCWAGLSAVFPGEPEAIGLGFRFLRYALMTWWVVFLAPWLFLKMKLAAPPERPVAERPVPERLTAS